MTATLPIFTAAEVRAAVSIDDAFASARTAFTALHAGTVESPTPWQLGLTGHGGELHVKGAALDGAPHFAVKLSSGFPGNARRGLPTSDGMTVILDASTGQIAALLLDAGYLTELRTGAAGALALDLLGPPHIAELAVIGTGSQARYQIEAALRVRAPQLISIHGRNHARAEELATWTAGRTDAHVTTVRLGGAPLSAQAIITVTPSTSPVLHAHQVAPGTHVTAVGSDGPGKRELDPALVRKANFIAVDSIHQSRTLGELQGIDDVDDRLTTLGAVLAARPRGSRATTDITIADLSGTGAQDAAIASIAVTRLQHQG